MDNFQGSGSLYISSFITAELYHYYWIHFLPTRMWGYGVFFVSPNSDNDGLVQERHNSIATALQLPLPCTNPSIYLLPVCLCHCNAECHIDGLMQERRNSSALAVELRLSCTNPLIWCCAGPRYNGTWLYLCTLPYIQFSSNMCCMNW